MESKSDEESLGTAVLLADEQGSLSKQIISDYFTSDGPRARRFGAIENAPERTILDESSGEEEPRINQPDTVDDVGRPSLRTLTGRAKVVLEETPVWEVVVVMGVVLLAVAHCMWVWNLLELSVLSLEYKD